MNSRIIATQVRENQSQHSLLVWFCLLLSVALLVSCGSEKSETAKVEVVSIEGPLHEIEFVFIKDAQAFLDYKQKLQNPSVMKNGLIERTLIAEQMWAKDAVKPDIVNLVYYDSAAAKEQMLNDPDYMALASFREKAIATVSVSGESVGGELVNGKLDKRAYMIEFVDFREDDPAGYDKYVSFSTTLMERYGYHLERVIKPVTSDGIAQPDLIRVMYFDTQEQMKKMESDPDHAEMLRLYEASVERSLWILATTSSDFGPLLELLGRG